MSTPSIQVTGQLNGAVHPQIGSSGGGIGQIDTQLGAALKTSRKLPIYKAAFVAAPGLFFSNTKEILERHAGLRIAIDTQIADPAFLIGNWHSPSGIPFTSLPAWLIGELEHKRIPGMPSVFNTQPYIDGINELVAHPPTNPITAFPLVTNEPVHEHTDPMDCDTLNPYPWDRERSASVWCERVCGSTRLAR